MLPKTLDVKSDYEKACHWSLSKNFLNQTVVALKLSIQIDRK